eukprot:9061736-Pyramimonas_sp.AAC.1
MNESSSGEWRTVRHDAIARVLRGSVHEQKESASQSERARPPRYVLIEGLLGPAERQEGTLEVCGFERSLPEVYALHGDSVCWHV